MKPDEIMEELFKAYLGSLELTEEQWKIREVSRLQKKSAWIFCWMRFLKKKD